MKFRQRPIEIEAEQFFPEEKRWPKGVYGKLHVWSDLVATSYNVDLQKRQYMIYYIDTPDGKSRVNIGDYIITGIKGERYPCKQNIFKETYESV